jgi:hypothetical protein
MILEMDRNYSLEVAFNLRNHEVEFIIAHTLVRPEEYFRVRIKREGALILRE